MPDDSQFQYASSAHLPGVTVLRAMMTTFSYDRHAHEEHALGVTLSGLQDFYSGGEHRRSTPGTVVHFEPGEVHDGHSGSAEPLNYAMLYIPPGQITPWLVAAGGKCARHVRLDATQLRDTVLQRRILHLARTVLARDGTALAEEQALYRIAERIAERAGRYDPDAVARTPDTLLLRARDYIDDHAGEPLSLEDISRAVNLSKYHLLRAFRRQFGITPHQYVLNRRVNAARAALDAGANLNDVVYRFGFADLSHFTRRFKRIYGMTPGRYRASIAG